MQEEFKQNYEEYLPHKPKTSQTSKKKVCIYKLFIFFYHFKSLHDDSDDSESPSSSSDEEEFADELDHYLSSGHIKGVENPIMWWHENQASYPHLLHMAKDFLSILGKFFFRSQFSNI